MLNDYKGEKPNNVITEEEHKKRPFYKKVSFWVLSALGLFFGGCSVYGLVLGYQYVHAVTEAAHVIADANASSGQDSTKPNVRSLFPSSGTPDHVAFNFTIDASFEDGFYLLDGTPWVSGNDQATIRLQNSFLTLWYGNSYRLAWDDYCTGISFNNFVFNPNAYAPFGSYVLVARPATFQGVFNYKAYQTGYQDGYDDGSDVINLSQSVKVLLPVGNEYSVQYKSYVDGVVDRQGQLNSSQTGGAYATFDRSRTQKLRIDLTLPSGSRAFFLYTPSWTSAYPTDENYSLRQSWAVSGVTYLPTWISKPQIYVGVTPADVPDLTYETISVAFDVDHWGDIKVGAYSQGYNDGYQAGVENPTAYDSGYDAGYSQGYDDGHTIGIAQGESQAVSGQKALVNMFVTAFQQPFDQIYRFLNFNVLGLNILALFTALLTLSIGIIIIKKVI